MFWFVLFLFNLLLLFLIVKSYVIVLYIAVDLHELFPLIDE